MSLKEPKVKGSLIRGMVMRAFNLSTQGRDGRLATHSKPEEPQGDILKINK